MRKKYNFLSVVIVFAFLSLTAIAAADPYVCGDADASGGIDIDDVVFLINYIFAGGPAPDPYESGDADGSGSVDIDDVVYLIYYVFSGGPDPVCTCGTVTDYDGNVYPTIRIGDQCWMTKNLKVTHYRNGDPIPNVTDGGEWANLTTGAFCNYDYGEGHVATYGRLYNWHAVDDSRNIAPAGWHVPTDDEWKELEMCLGMSQADADAMGGRGTDEGGKLKEAGTARWVSPNEGATNESGFTALPAGCRYSNGNFRGIGYYALSWSSTERGSHDAWSRGLEYNTSHVSRGGGHKRDGFSVRCVRD